MCIYAVFSYGIFNLVLMEKRKKRRQELHQYTLKFLTEAEKCKKEKEKEKKPN